MVKEVREPLPVSPGQVLKYDREYDRNGTVSIFMAFEPLQEVRYTKITEQRTQIDWVVIESLPVDLNTATILTAK